jgi:hypothetical protein
MSWQYTQANKISFHQNELNAEKLLVAFADRPAERVTPQDIERFLAGRNTQPATQNRRGAVKWVALRLSELDGRASAYSTKVV